MGITVVTDKTPDLQQSIPNEDVIIPENEIDRLEQLKQLTHCTFCGKTRQEVKLLIARSPMIGICSECVVVCMEIIIDEARGNNKADK